MDEAWVGIAGSGVGGIAQSDDLDSRWSFDILHV